MMSGFAEHRVVEIFVLLLFSEFAVTQTIEEQPTSSRLCTEHAGDIRCDVVPVAGHNLTITGHLQTCINPVYIQFTLQVVNDSRKDEYTFINADESQRVRSLSRYVIFHVALRDNQDYVFVKAGFLEEGIITYFLERHIKRPETEENCPTAHHSKVMPFVVVSIGSLVLAVCGSLLLLWWYRRRKRAARRATELLADMEISPTSLPYQEEPITADISTPRPNSTTVIHNALYRDSVVLNDGLDTIQEEGVCNENGSNGRRHHTKPPKTQRSNHRPKKSGRRSDKRSHTVTVEITPQRSEMSSESQNQNGNNHNLHRDGCDRDDMSRDVPDLISDSLSSCAAEMDRHNGSYMKDQETTNHDRSPQGRDIDIHRTETLPVKLDPPPPART